ncbi:MAG: tetratricopeptide repeat protein [Candidatus Accumulibacter sp.]|uniref:Tetratricopeptide repeat protein n=1 Tax=Candidatus Accumulibacter affinis TaxID=2954384 RepID=A0A935T6G1_9PROT|nr:tetratricopeptide repeat protein [Candidatus Accumulibacter affinis]MBP9804075.1 tetratricopeptide repeat protein [Accumulibacter sp.]
MEFAEQLRIIEAAQGDPAKLALATVDLAYPDLPSAERAALRAALEAAAIAHWCDEAILAALLETSPEESGTQLVRLQALRVVERFPARGDKAINVHEASRLALRTSLAYGAAERFRAWSARAAAYWAADPSAAGRIEWIYHLLSSDPDRGASELESLDRRWSSEAHPEDRYALAAALGELEKAGLLQGRARVWVLLVIAWTRASRGESSQLADVARQTLCLARAATDPRAEADAQCLLGDALRAQGQLKPAQRAFAENLAISHRLARQNPSSAGWQRELAVAHSRFGDVLQERGQFTAAQAAFAKCLEISRRLAEYDPSNAGWQRKLAVAYSRVGGLLQAQRHLEAAQEAFVECLAISRRLAKHDPSNAGWQRDLAVAYHRVCCVLQAQGEREAAQAALAETLAISRRLAEQDPSNADWQGELAVASWWQAALHMQRGNPQMAVGFYEDASRILGALTEKAPHVVQWAGDRDAVDAALARCRLMIESGKSS